MRASTWTDKHTTHAIDYSRGVIACGKPLKPRKWDKKRRKHGRHYKRKYVKDRKGGRAVTCAFCLAEMS